MASIPIQRLRHANVVVNDARATAQHYARLLGITRWEVRHVTPQRLARCQAFGYGAEFGYTTATGRNAQGVTFRLVQPTHGFSTFTEYLISRGEGVHSLCTARLSAPEMESLAGDLYQHDDATAAQVSVDEVWNLRGEHALPADVRWLAEIPRIGHFGIAVSNLTDRLPDYARVLDVSRWNGVHFHATPGGLEHATLDGQVVDNAWLLAITDVADFGLEVLQGTRAPTDYQRTVQRIGEGIHHILVRRGAGEFFYLDTRAALGGYLLEVLVSREVPEASNPPTPANWRFGFDFTNKV